MKKLFLSFFALFLLISCSTLPQKTVDEKGNYSWESEKFELNTQNQAFSAEGAVTMWIDVEQFKGKFTGDYQILSSEPEKWRMIITGPFNISVATVIINGDTANIFHEGIWDSGPWNEISKQLFNASVDGDLFSVMLGGRFRFDGECADIGSGDKLCRKNGIYYKISQGKVAEIASGDLYIVSEKKTGIPAGKGRRGKSKKQSRKTVKKAQRWIGVSRGKPAFIFENKYLDASAELPESLFEAPKSDEPDIFDEL
ncbi:hypothetical protein J6253_05550 [bacterium]|nr:hypothetical protein [bacterium]MBP5202186.1 hypothetical protein [bacterium]